MELALNVCWLMLSCLLCGGCMWAFRRGRVRLSLQLALGCTLLIAMLLFPAISMTDDLQRTNNELEHRVRMQAVTELVSLEQIGDLSMLLLAMLCVGALARTRLRLLAAPCRWRMRMLLLPMPALPVRPPTALAI